ncbi:MAG: cupin domain-containing protein [bacterium]|nr:cupin domain-containing protein [bacterium]
MKQLTKMEKMMIVKKYEEVEKKEVLMEGVKDASVRWLIGEDSPAPNFHMRLFQLEPGGHSPFHSHDFEHEIYVVEGVGQLMTQKDPLPLEQGSFALVMPNEEHQFRNMGETPFKFLCMIPNQQTCCK